MSGHVHHKSALEEMVEAMIADVESDPARVIDRAWCEGVLDVLLAMDPALAFPVLRRTRRVLMVHAQSHGCAAPTVFDECYEARLAALAVR